MRLSSLNCCLENFVGNLKFPIYKGASTHMVIKTRIRFCVFQIKFTNLALKFTNYIITLAVYQFLPTCVKYSHNGNFLLHILALIEKKNLPNKCNNSYFRPIICTSWGYFKAEAESQLVLIT